MLSSSQRTSSRRTQIRRSLSIEDSNNNAARSNKGGAKGRKNWTQEHTELLFELISQYKPKSSIAWDRLSNKFNDRSGWDQFKSGDQCKKRFIFCRNIPPQTGSSSHHAYRIEADRLHHMICKAAGISSIGETPGEDDDVTEIGDEFEQSVEEVDVDNMTTDQKHMTDGRDTDTPHQTESDTNIETAPTQPLSPIINVRAASSSGLSVGVADMRVSSPSPSPSPSSSSESSHVSASRGQASRNSRKSNNVEHESPAKQYRVSAKRKDDTTIDTPATKQRRHTANTIDNLVTSNSARAESADSFQRMLLITMQQERQEAREREERRDQRELEYKREVEERRLEEKRREIEEKRRDDLKQEQQERQHREFMIALFAAISGKSTTSSQQPHT